MVHGSWFMDASMISPDELPTAYPGYLVRGIRIPCDTRQGVPSCNTVTGHIGLDGSMPEPGVVRGGWAARRRTRQHEGEQWSESLMGWRRLSAAHASDTRTLRILQDRASAPFCSIRTSIMSPCAGKNTDTGWVPVPGANLAPHPIRPLAPLAKVS